MAFHEWLFEWSGASAPLMANHLWQATVFSLLVFAAARFLRRGPARVRHALWLMASLKFALPSDLFLLSIHYAGVDLGLLFGPNDAPAGAPQTLGPVPLTPAGAVEGAASAVSGTQAGHGEMLCALFIVWAVGCLLTLSLWCSKRFQISSALKGRTGTESGRVSQALSRVRGRLGMKRPVKVVISRDAIEPGIWRVWRPVLALPASLPEHLSDDELDAMLMHELIHISRRDNLVSNLSMMVCCLFWFHPVVWIIDRRLLSERESSCDERVMELGVSSKVYAASLLKVLRFCVGWKVAGGSAATGSNLQKRVDSILAFRAGARAGAASRYLIGSFAASVVAFTIAAGLLVPSDAVAQSLKAPRAAGAERAQDSADRLVPAQAPKVADVTPQPAGGSPLSGREGRELIKEAEKAPFTPARFNNLDGAPLVITDAKMKVVAYEKGPSSSDAAPGARELLIMPRLSLVNNTNRRITSVHVLSKIAPVSYAVTTHRVNIGPYESFVLQIEENDWSEVLPAGSARNMVFFVPRVRFEDDSEWSALKVEQLEPVLAPAVPQPGAALDVLQPVTAPPAIPQPGSPSDIDAVIAPARIENGPPAQDRAGEYVPAQFENPAGAPLVVHSALTPAGGSRQSNADAAEQTALPAVTLVNASDRRIVSVKLRFKADADEHAVSAFRLALGPGESYTYRTNRRISGRPGSMKVQVIGVQFEDGSVWGSMDSRIDTRDNWVPVPQTIRKP
ncbi:MAG TPA: M56 family metallopeptidase [Blastocatellia bacterium]|nr:M56 family metallopeptidase [Blastocatellia bacterium]